MMKNAKEKRTASGVSTPNNVSNICPLPCFVAQAAATSTRVRLVNAGARSPLAA
jgi:hypothetical protein